MICCFPGQSPSIVNGRALIIYDGKRPWFTLTAYSDHIRYFTVHNDYRKQQSYYFIVYDYRDDAVTVNGTRIES